MYILKCAQEASESPILTGVYFRGKDFLILPLRAVLQYPPRPHPKMWQKRVSDLNK